MVTRKQDTAYMSDLNGIQCCFTRRFALLAYPNSLTIWRTEGLTYVCAESVLLRRLELDMALSLNAGNDKFLRFYNALARLLTGLLDRDEMDPSQSYVYGAKELSGTLRSNRAYDRKAKVWYMKDDSGHIFLQPQIDWEKYHQNCYPEYCEVIKPMRGAQKLFWAFGILGGVATIVLAVVTTLLWPCTAMLLLWISNCKTVEIMKPETPQVALVAEPQPTEPTS